MLNRYYFDTSIWLDLIEDRDEPNLPKGLWAQKLFGKIILDDSKILYSDMTISELKVVGYSQHELNNIFKKLNPVLVFVNCTNKQVKKAKNISSRRGVPKGDVLHALVARNNSSVLVTLDKHFKKLADITRYSKPQDLI